jgi:hypothetical protein
MKLRNFGYVAIAALVAVAFAIGSAVPSEAKDKKKVAAPQPQPACWFSDKKVCAVKAGKKVTYQNACYAGNDGAKLVSDKACPEKAAKKGGKKMKKGGKKKK